MPSTIYIFCLSGTEPVEGLIDDNPVLEEEKSGSEDDGDAIGPRKRKQSRMA